MTSEDHVSLSRLPGLLVLDDEIDMEIAKIRLAGSMDCSFVSDNRGENAFASWMAANAQLGFGTLRVPAYLVGAATEILEGTSTGVSTVIGYPNGHQSLATTCFAAAKAAMDGATDIALVMNTGQFKEGHDGYIYEAITGAHGAAMSEAYDSNHLTFRVIIGIDHLSDSEICRASDLVSECEVDIVETCIEDASREVSVDDVRLINSCIAPGSIIAASSGIMTLQDVVDMLAGGASRVITDNGDGILNMFDDRFCTV